MLLSRPLATTKNNLLKLLTSPAFQPNCRRPSSSSYSQRPETSRYPPIPAGSTLLTKRARLSIPQRRSVETTQNESLFSILFFRWKVIASSNHLGNNDMLNLTTKKTLNAKMRVKSNIFAPWEEDINHEVRAALQA